LHKCSNHYYYDYQYRSSYYYDHDYRHWHYNYGNYHIFDNYIIDHDDDNDNDRATLHRLMYVALARGITEMDQGLWR
jgi:hypothetical protein